MSTVETALANVADRDAETVRVYHELVRRLADGFEPPADDVDRALASGKTTADLKTDVARLVRRRELAGKLVVPDAAAEREKIQGEIAKLGEQLVAAQRSYNAALAPLQARMGQLDRARLDAKTAARELRRTASEELREQEVVLNRRRNAVASKRSDLRQAIARHDAVAVDSTERGDSPTADAAKKHAAQRRQDLARLEEVSRSIDAEGIALSRLMLEP